MVDQPLPPVLEDRYEIRAILGSGGMGTVYRAWDRTLRREVALKLLHAAPAGEVALARFRREARCLAGLAHPGIVRLYDASLCGTIPYLVMELLEGESLAERIGPGILTPSGVAALLCGILDALAHVHAAGLLHRDLKPSNVFLRGGRTPVLVDFGLVRSDAPGETLLTAAGMCVGTPKFMPPELVAGREAAVPSDLHQVALIGYEALTGQNLHGSVHDGGAPALETVLSSISSGTYFHVAARALSIHGPLGAVLLRTLHPNPSRRFASAPEMLHAIQVATSSEPGKRHTDQQLPAPAVNPAAATIPRRAGPRVALVVLVLASVVWLVLRPGPGSPVHGSTIQRTAPPSSSARMASPAHLDLALRTRVARSLALLARLQLWSGGTDVPELARRMEGLATTAGGRREAGLLLRSILERASIAPALGSLEMASSTMGPVGQDLYWQVFRLFTLERIAGGDGDRRELPGLFPEDLRPGVLPSATARPMSCSLAGRRVLGTPGLLGRDLTTVPGLELLPVREVAFGLDVRGLARSRRAWLVLQVGKLTRREFITLRVNGILTLGLTTAVIQGVSTTVSHTVPPSALREGANQLVARLDSLTGAEKTTELVRCTLFLE